MFLLAAHLLTYRSSLCLHPGSGLLLSCFYIASLWLRRFLWVGLWQVVFVPSFLCVWSQRPWEDDKLHWWVKVFCTFFARSPSRIWWIVKICDIKDCLIRKHFWFILSIFTIFASIRLRSGALYIVATMDVRVIPRQFLAILWSSLFREAGMHSFVPLSIVLCLYTALQCQSNMSSNSIVFRTSGVFHQALVLS